MTPGRGRRLGLGRDKKLRETDEFSSVFRFKRVMRGSCVDLYWRPNGLDQPRLGLVVSRRVARHATLRNKYKRLMREAFRQGQHQLAPLDLVARLKMACPVERFREEFTRLLHACRSDLEGVRHRPPSESSP